MTCPRSAPKVGYDTDAKHEYRKMIWSGIGAAVPDLRKKNIFLLPALEAREVSFLVANGFDQRKMVLCDRNPATIATVVRSKGHHGLGYGLCKGYGVDVARVGARLRRDGVSVTAAHLDLTANLCDRTLATFAHFVAGCPWESETNVVVMNYMKGRESRGMSDLLREVAGRYPHDTREVGFRSALLARIVGGAAWQQGMVAMILTGFNGTYLSGRAPMSYLGMAIVDPRRLRSGYGDISYAVRCAIEHGRSYYHVAMNLMERYPA